MGCILYQMIYGNPPFAHIPGGPLPKMNAIANPKYVITYPAEAVPRANLSSHGTIEEHTASVIRVGSAAIDTMRRCLAYQKEQRLTIPELLRHEFLHPRTDRKSAEYLGLIFESALPPGTATITQEQMAMLVNFVVRQNGLPPLPSSDTTASVSQHSDRLYCLVSSLQDLFEQLVEQNSHN
jgi:serine/threonine-protein kinase TTK/MPS1